jgi:hypothetical protein
MKVKGFVWEVLQRSLGLGAQGKEMRLNRAKPVAQSETWERGRR